jgi:hypothetical protein
MKAWPIGCVWKSSWVCALVFARCSWPKVASQVDRHAQGVCVCVQRAGA